MKDVMLVCMLICFVVMVSSQSCYDSQDETIISSIRSSLTTLQENLQRKHLTGCKKDWKIYNDHCYYFSSDTKPWFEAERTCREQGGYLAQITDSVENDWIAENIKATDFIEGDWQWANDLSKMQYSPWAPGEPGNANGDEDCLVIHSSWNKKWHDGDCKNAFLYVCETQSGVNCIPYSKSKK